MTVDDDKADMGAKEKVVNLLFGIPEDQKEDLIKREHRITHMSGCVGVGR